jgi:hypothetical protein
MLAAAASSGQARPGERTAMDSATQAWQRRWTGRATAQRRDGTAPTEMCQLTRTAPVLVEVAWLHQEMRTTPIHEAVSQAWQPTKGATTPHATVVARSGTAREALAKELAEGIPRVPVVRRARPRRPRQAIPAV